MKKFHFVCDCGCGKQSKELKENYLRLIGGNRWVSEKPKKEEIVRAFMGGYIVGPQEDF